MIGKKCIQPGIRYMRKQITNHRLLLLIIFLSIVLRLGAAMYLGDTLVGEQQRRAHDQISYNYLANSLLVGKGFSFDQDWYPFTPANTPTAHWSFLYSIFLAGVYALTGPHPFAARLVQVLIVGILLPWFLYKLGSRIAGKTIGLLSAGLGTVYLYFVYYDASLMTEPFFILGILAMLNLALKLQPGNWEDKFANSIGFPTHLLQSPQKLIYWIALGIVLGITALLRQTILLWVPFLFIWIVWAGRGRIRPWGPTLTLGMTALLILPWTVRNYVVYEAFLPLNSNAGYALYSANHPDHGTQFIQDYAAPLPADLQGAGLNEAQWNTELTKRGLQFILDDLGRYLLLSLNRVGIFFNFWFSPESTLISNWMRVLSFGLYLPFFVYGLILSLKEWRRFSLLYLFAIIYSSMHILTWAGIRYRLPVDAAMMPFAALAVLNVIQHLSFFMRKRSQPLLDIKS
jgi:4-amino-4-deoxy-L-arabinose transferase-like glycosyltransferase